MKDYRDKNVYPYLPVIFDGYYAKLVINKSKEITGVSDERPSQPSSVGTGRTQEHIILKIRLFLAF